MGFIGGSWWDGSPVGIPKKLEQEIGDWSRISGEIPIGEPSAPGQGELLALRRGIVFSTSRRDISGRRRYLVYMTDTQLQDTTN